MKHRGLGVSESLCKAPPRLTGILFNDNLQGVEIEDRRASRARLVFQLQVSLLEAFEPPGGRHMGDCAEAHRLVDSVGGHACRGAKAMLVKKEESELLSRNCSRFAACRSH
ncbi:hypothetical protein WR25_16560 [Diploscapter pachys]|uniref:Uncharacterized protein n=1 Tax=Diploscapter pachys TaxID=2018661 RepID=A0A2A2L192_9BILA|nr:hypothetical protein WR25_16560 [Diploscapter pachys]